MRANNFSPPFPPPVTPGAQAVPRGTPLGSPPRYPLGPVTPLGTSQVTPGVNPAPRVLHRDTQVPRYPWGTPGVLGSTQRGIPRLIRRVPLGVSGGYTPLPRGIPGSHDPACPVMTAAFLRLESVASLGWRARRRGLEGSGVV